VNKSGFFSPEVNSVTAKISQPPARAFGSGPFPQVGISYEIAKVGKCGKRVNDLNVRNMLDAGPGE